MIKTNKKSKMIKTNKKSKMIKDKKILNIYFLRCKIRSQ